MKSKSEKKVPIFSFLMFLLVLILSMLSTYKFVNIPKKDNAVDQVDKKFTNDTKLSFQQGSTSGNLSADGRFSYGDNCEYISLRENGRANLYKIKNNKEKELIMSSDDIRLLNQIGKYLYCVIDKGEKSTVAKIDIDTNEMMYLKTTESSHINSLMFNRDYAYYTVKGSSNIYRLNEDDSITKIYESLEFAGDSFLIGIFKDSVIFVNSRGLFGCSNSGKLSPINSEISSIYQKPILANDKVIFFSNLRKDSVSILDLNTNEVTKIEEKNISFYNFIDGFLFITDGTNIKSSSDYKIFNKIEDIKLKNQQFYLTNKHLVANNNGELEYYKISWILTS